MSAPAPPLAVVLLAHGSPDPEWLRPVEQIADRLRALAPAHTVAVATLEHGLALGDLVARLREQGVRRVVVVPVFLSGGGRHMRRDVPELVARLQRDCDDLEIALAGDALATDPDVLDALAAAALRRVARSSLG
jgi:sirohydrochlorin cobaltochelatase